MAENVRDRKVGDPPALLTQTAPTAPPQVKIRVIRTRQVRVMLRDRRKA